MMEPLNIHNSLQRDFTSGLLSIEQVAAEYNNAGHTNFVDVDYARRQMDNDDFKLVNDPEPKKKTKESRDKPKQRLLFSGLDCLPGQQDLFDTDGKIDSPK